MSIRPATHRCKSKQSCSPTASIPPSFRVSMFRRAWLLTRCCSTSSSIFEGRLFKKFVLFSWETEKSWVKGYSYARPTWKKGGQWKAVAAMFWSCKRFQFAFFVLIIVPISCNFRNVFEKLSYYTSSTKHSRRRLEKLLAVKFISQTLTYTDHRIGHSNREKRVLHFHSGLTRCSCLISFLAALFE